MSQKIPSLFTKKFSGEQFTKKILSRTFLNEEKEFLNSVFIKNENNEFVLRVDLSKDEIKRLKKLEKTIKQNTGVVQKGKLAVLLIFLGVIAIFYIFFKNVLLENVIEQSLTGAFSARTDIDNLDFDIIGARISFSAMTVGNSKEAFKNLFELGKTEVALNMAELFRGKIVIENVECRGVKWNTDRKTSGLPVEPEEEKKQETPFTMPDASTINIRGIDARQILNEQIDKLKSPGRITEANESFKKLIDKWNVIPGTYRQDLNDMEKSVESIKKIKIENIKTPAEIQTIVEQIQTAYVKGVELKTKIQDTTAEIKSDVNFVELAKNGITSAIGEDTEFLLSFVQNPEAQARSIFSSMSRRFLKANLGEFYDYGLLAYNAIAGMKRTPKEDKARIKTEDGYDVPFPGATTPDFLIKNAGFSIGDAGDSEYLSVNLSNVSSAPDLLSGPAAYDIRTRQMGQDFTLKGEIDTRTGKTDIFSMDFTAGSVPMKIGSGLEGLGIASLDTVMDARVKLTLGADNSMTGGMSIDLKDLKTEFISTADTVSRTIAGIFSSLKQISLNADYVLSQSQELALKADSNIDELLSRKIGGYLEEQLKKGSSQLREEFSRFIEDELKENKDLYNIFKQTEKHIGTDLENITDYNNILAEKKREWENGEAQLKKQLEDAAKKEIDKNVEDLKKTLGF
ncbi:MAG: TIGR03545 family protein [Spirochaetales bacterium]|nr:TIGR03545 family protein [Spirochaetales bacterium]